MSVLIKGMAMPERCLECPLYDNYNYYCILYSFGIPARYNRDGSTRPEWCELEELPSAQPEITHCRDCAKLQIDNIFHDYWCDGKRVRLDHYCGYAERWEE